MSQRRAYPSRYLSAYKQKSRYGRLSSSAEAATRSLTFFGKSARLEAMLSCCLLTLLCRLNWCALLDLIRRVPQPPDVAWPLPSFNDLCTLVNFVEERAHEIAGTVGSDVSVQTIYTTCSKARTVFTLHLS